MVTASESDDHNLPHYVSFLTVGTTAQYDTSYCQGKKGEMTARWEEWATAWDTATIDPGGQIRANCQPGPPVS